MVGGTFRNFSKVKISHLKVSAPWQVCNCNLNRTNNDLVHKRTLNHLAKFNHLATWLSVPLQILSFVLEFHELNTFLKLNPKFNFNIILSSAIKSHAFIPYKKSCFYKMKSFGKRKVLYFCLRLFSRKYTLQSFHSKYLRNCYRSC